MWIEYNYIYIYMYIYIYWRLASCSIQWLEHGPRRTWRLCFNNPESRRGQAVSCGRRDGTLLRQKECDGLNALDGTSHCSTEVGFCPLRSLLMALVEARRDSKPVGLASLTDPVEMIQANHPGWNTACPCITSHHLFPVEKLGLH